MSVNKVMLIGNLGRDPELRHTKSGSEVCTLSVATTRRQKNRQTEQYEDVTDWHDVVTFGQTASNCEQYLSKGRQVYVEGRLQTRSWEDKETGKKRYATEVIADIVKFLGGRDDGGQRGRGGYQDDNRGRGRQQSRGGPEPYDPGGYRSGRKDDEPPF